MWRVSRGSGGSSPPPFFYSGGKLKTRRAKKERKNRRTKDWRRSPFPSAPIFNAPPPAALVATINLAVFSNHRFWRRDGITHIVLRAVSSPELAIRWVAGRICCVNLYMDPHDATKKTTTTWPQEKLIGIAIIANNCNISLFLLQIYHFIYFYLLVHRSDIAIYCQ